MSQKTSSSNLKIPVWAQLVVGLVLVGLIFIIGTQSTRFVSSWYEEDSNFYQNALQVLEMSDIHPSAPSAVLFWQVNCEPCKKTMKILSTLPAPIRIYGIHIADKATDETKIRETWREQGMPADALVIDKSEILQTGFKVMAVPETFVIFPRKKKIMSYLGDITKGQKQLHKLLSSGL